MTLRFSDGMSFDTSGELRVVRKHDGLYVVGKGMLIPVDSPQEAREIMKEEKMHAHAREISKLIDEFKNKYRKYNDWVIDAIHEPKPDTGRDADGWSLNCTFVNTVNPTARVDFKLDYDMGGMVSYDYVDHSGKCQTAGLEEGFTIIDEIDEQDTYGIANKVFNEVKFVLDKIDQVSYIEHIMKDGSK